MNLGKLFTKLGRSEYIEVEYIKNLKLFYHVKDAFLELAKTIDELEPGE